MRPLAILTAALLFAPAAFAQTVTTPEQHLKRKVGADFKLADWKEVSGYFRTLAKQSPRVNLKKVGTTTEGRDFLLAIISSKKNLANLPAIKARARRIADPRGLKPAERKELLKQGKLILFVSCAMHSTETAAPQLGMELAYRLATSTKEPWVSAREKMVVLLAPTLNPDGLDEVVKWYRKTVGTPHEGSGLTRLYQLYAGHDNNRDWFSLTQNETRIVTRLLYSEWFPQVYWDVHQQGRGRERFFLPPYRDPLNPNLDPAIIAGIDAIGSRALLDMTRGGFSGVSTGVTYDMWWNGGNRNVPVRHNIIGILTEAASVHLASPVFLPRKELKPPRGIAGYAPSNRFPYPWPGGWWRLRNIIDYELAFARSLFGTLTREPKTWLGNALEAAERAIAKGRKESPRAWLIPSSNRDRGAVRRLADGLLLGGVELFVSDAAFLADGRRWPAGTIVIPRDQPYGAHVKDLFEVQRYPDGVPPYDVAGWTLPFLFGVRRVEVARPFKTELRRVKQAGAAIKGFPGRAVVGRALLDSGDSDTWPRVFAALRKKRQVSFFSEGEHAGYLAIGKEEADKPLPGKVVLRKLPRIGVYAPWRGVMDEGWLRWVLDSRKVPYVRVRNEMVKAGKLREFLDVLVLPSMWAELLEKGRAPGTAPSRFTGGLAPEGAVAIEEFVRQGGTLIALGGSGRWVQELFKLPLKDVAAPPKKPAAPYPASPVPKQGPAAPPTKPFSCPGSVVRAIPERSGFTAGLEPSLAVFFSRSSAWQVVPPKSKAKGRPGPVLAPPAAKQKPDVQVLLRYAPTRVLLSGWIQSPQIVAGKPAWLRIQHGKGRIHLFGFRPQYRGWSQGTFQLLFRALLLEGRL